MVMNVLTSFQFQKLQNPNANSSIRTQQVKKNTLIRKTAKKRRRRDIKSSLPLQFDNSFLFFCKINQSPPPCHSLKHWTCARASQHSLPSSLGHSSRSDILLSGSLIFGVRNTYIYISFSHHIQCALRWPFLVQQIRGFLLSAADLFAEDCFVLHLRHSQSSCVFLNWLINMVALK